MLNRFLLAALATIFLLAGATTATAAPDRPPTPPPTDFWQDRHNLGEGKYFLNMAHQGGEVEAPASTLYAFDTAIRERGADTLEMDGYVTQDGHFVITHDFNPVWLSNIASTAHAGKTINQLTLAELKTLDFAHYFLPGVGHYGIHNGTNGHGEAEPEDYIYRGIALGDKAPPEGYTPNDFKIPTLQEVLDAFPDTPMNIDLKNNSGAPGIEIEAAEVVAEVMKEYPERSEDVIIASFTSAPIVKFHELHPDHKALSAGEDSLLSYIQGNPVVPTPVAAQPPEIYNLGGNPIPTVPVLKPHTDHDGFAIHVWPRGDEGPTLWQTVIDQGADGFFTQQPGELHEFLCEQGIPRPDGTPRCPAQECPRGKTGYAPDNCEFTPGTLAGFKVVPKKRKLAAGRKAKVKVTLKNSGGAPLKLKIVFRSNNRQVKVRKSLNVTVPGLKTITRAVPVRATRKAKRRAVIKVRVNGKSRKSVFQIKALKKKKKPKKQKRARR